MLIIVKQWQQPVGHEHSEQRCRHGVPVTQQNHSPVVVQPTGHPPACAHGLQRKLGLVQTGCGEKQLLHGPPPHPEQPPLEPRVTSVRVRNRPAPSELAPMNLKNCRRDDFLARLLDACSARLIGSARRPPRPFRPRRSA
jgi:hypothetical protein